MNIGCTGYATTTFLDPKINAVTTDQYIYYHFFVSFGETNKEKTY